MRKVIIVSGRSQDKIKTSGYFHEKVKFIIYKLNYLKNSIHNMRSIFYIYVSW